MGRLTLLGLLRSQWSPIHPVVTANLAGKTVVITGSNTGLGFEAAKHFAKMNPGRLILACRSQEKGEVALGSTFKFAVWPTQLLRTA
jgi:retinol dehydrogenase-12